MNLPSSGKDQHSETNQQSLSAQAAKTDFVVVRNGIELNESNPTSLNAHLAVSLSGTVPTSPLQKTANDYEESQTSRQNSENRAVAVNELKSNSFEMDSQGRTKKHRNHSKKAVKSAKKNKNVNKKKIQTATLPSQETNQNDLSIQQTERSNDSIETPENDALNEKQARLQVTTEFVGTPQPVIAEQDPKLEESPDPKTQEKPPEDRKNQTTLQFPPPLDVYRPKINVNHECVSYGLNMYFKKPHKCSEDPDQAGGDLAQNQTFLSQPWGIGGCPPQKQVPLTQYVMQNIQDVVFSRYGMEYLKSFPRSDDIQIGSYRINLDYLIFQKQKQNQNTESKNSLVEMSFLKIKGQNQMNKAMAAAQSQKDVPQGNANPGARMIIPFYKTLDAETQHNTLEFDSVFESGNLALALKVSDTEYDCLLQNDINTNGHTQWFYFKVKSNFKKATSVKIKLINLYKCKSLFQYGMRVLTLDVSKSQNLDESTTTASTSKADQAPELPKWQRSCSNISYIQNKYTNDFSPNGLYQVEFTYEFGKGPKEIYFAHSLPYTYSMLNEYLGKQKVKRYTLCHTLAGNKVEYLYVTSKGQNSSSAVVLQDQQQQQQAQPQNTKANGKKPKQNPAATEPKAPPPIQKQVIMITSRVHPGETGASWMVHGLIDTLLNPSTAEEKRLVKNLKDHFEFYIIPMLNVDGVINGNYRCSLAACDLNRKWSKPSKALHPSVYYTKKLCQTLTEAENKQFFLYLDLHGHSVKKNIFQYGNKMENLAPSRQRCSNTMQPAVFPMVLSKQFDYFNFQDCTFSMPKAKDSTARISMFHKLRIPFVFTLEASFAGANRGALAGKHFSQRDLMNVGKYVLQAFWEVKKLQMNKTLLRAVAAEAQSQARVSNDDEPDSEGCSSSEEEGELPTSANAKKAIEVIQEEESPLKVQAAEESAAPESPSLSGMATRKALKNEHSGSWIIQLIQTQQTQDVERPGRRASNLSVQNRAAKNPTGRGHEGRQAHLDQTQTELAQAAQALDVINNSGYPERGNSALRDKIKVMRKTQRLNIIGLQQDAGDYIEAVSFDPNATQVQQRSQCLADNELELAVPMSVRHQLYQPKFLDNASNYQIRRVEEHIQAMNNLERQQQLQQQQLQQQQQQWGSSNKKSRRHRMQQQATYQSGQNANNDLIQLPESITDNFIGQSTRNIHLQQFLLNHLSKKQRHNNVPGGMRPTSNLPALENGPSPYGKPPLAKHPSVAKQAVLMYATTYKMDYQDSDPQNEQREAYNISQTSKVSKGVKGSKLRTKEVKQANLRDKNPAAKTKAQWGGHANSATITQNAFYISRDYANAEEQPQQPMMDNSKRRYNSIQNGPVDNKQAPFLQGDSSPQDVIEENPIDFDFQMPPHTDMAKKQKSKSGMKKKGHNHLSDILPTEFDHKNRSLQFPPFSASANLHLQQMKSTQQRDPTMDQKIQRMSVEYDNKAGHISFNNQKIMQQIENSERANAAANQNISRQSKSNNLNSPFEQMYKSVYDPETKQFSNNISGRQSKTKVHMSIFPGAQNAAITKNQFGHAQESTQLLNYPKNLNINKTGSSDVLPDINQSFHSPSKSRLLIKPQQINFMGSHKRQHTLDNGGLSSPYSQAKKHGQSLLDQQIEHAQELYANINMESRLSNIHEVQNSSQRVRETPQSGLEHSVKPMSKSSRRRNQKDAQSERNSQLKSNNQALQIQPRLDQKPIPPPGQTYKVNFSSKINIVSSQTPQALNKGTSQFQNPKKK